MVGARDLGSFLGEWLGFRWRFFQSTEHGVGVVRCSFIGDFFIKKGRGGIEAGRVGMIGVGAKGSGRRGLIERVAIDGDADAMLCIGAGTQELLISIAAGRGRRRIYRGRRMTFERGIASLASQGARTGGDIASVQFGRGATELEGRIPGILIHGWRRGKAIRDRKKPTQEGRVSSGRSATDGGCWKGRQQRQTR